jgi:hypothetical protein
MDKILLRKIKLLKKIRPDASWLMSQRSFLLSEVSQSKETNKKPSLVLPLFNFNILKILKPSFAIALAIIILATSLATVGVISAAQNSLPGDFLYPAKTAVERIQLTFTTGQENKTKLSIKLASQRIDELTQLINKPITKSDKKQYEETVKEFTAQIVNLQENMDKLRAEGKLEVIKLIKEQTSIYQETLIQSSEKLSDIFPEDKKAIEENINQALQQITKTKEATEELLK